MNKNHSKIFLSSYSYKFSLGFKSFRLPQYIHTMDLLTRVSEYGLDGVQIVDNVLPEKFSQELITQIAEFSAEKGIELQWGFGDWQPRVIEKMLKICEATDARVLRGVFGNTLFAEKMGSQARVDTAVKAITGFLPDLERLNLTLAMENHFDLTSRELLTVIKEIDHPLVRSCLDTTNGLGRLERPEEVIRLLGQYSVAMHLKDYVINKVVGGYEILGVPVGEGEQNCAEIIQLALAENSEMEICIELGMAFPGDKQNVIEIENQWVNTSISNTRKYLKEIRQAI